MEREPMPAWWTPWSRLTPRGKIGRAFAIFFVVWHVAAIVTMGAAPKIRRTFAPVFTIYGERLKLTNTWGMFSKRPSSTHVRIEAIDVHGEAHLLATTEATGKGVLERFRDARLRKIQSKLGASKDRARFGAEYLDGWCRTAGLAVPEVREVRALQLLHELRDDGGHVTRKAEEKVVLRRTCSALKARTLPVTDEETSGDDGDDP